MKQITEPQRTQLRSPHGEVLCIVSQLTAVKESTAHTQSMLASVSHAATLLESVTADVVHSSSS